MPRSKLLLLAGIVIACHLAAIAAVATKSMVKSDVFTGRSYFQVVAVSKPVVEKSDLPRQKILREPVSPHSKNAVAATRTPTEQEQSQLKPDASLPDGEVKMTSGNTPNRDPTSDSLDDEAALAEILRLRLPNITSLVTLEFLIGADGSTKQVSWLEEGCSDALISSLSSLLDLRFKLATDGKIASDYRKIIEIEPFQGF